MSASEIAIDQTPEWAALKAHHARVRDLHLRDLFADDPGRGMRMTAEGAGVFLDYSKHRVTDDTMALLLDLARVAGVEERREAMFEGERINTTRTAPSSTRPCGRRRRTRSSSTGSTSSPRSTPSFDRMAAFAIPYATAVVSAIPGARSATSSTSGSAAATWARDGGRRGLRAPTSRQPSPVRVERRRRDIV